MGKLWEFLIGRRKWVALVICIIISLNMMLMGKEARLYFARQATASIFGFGQNVFSWAIYLTELHIDNERLREKNMRLSLDIQRQQELEKENSRLRNLIGLKEKSTYSLLAASVIAWNSKRLSNIVVLDRGFKDGVRKYMVVITDDGLVGRVSEVFKSYSTVQLLEDISSRVSAIIKNNDSVFGIVRWEGGATLKMDLLLRVQVQKGDIVVTSGVGPIYHGGLKIGEVLSTSRDRLGQYEVVDIKPYVEPERLREVFIILNFEKLALPAKSGIVDRPSLE